MVHPLKRHVMNHRITKAQKRVIEDMRAGRRLWSFGDNGLQIEGRSISPRPQTVSILLKKGLLCWKPYANPTQHECGIRELELAR